METTLLILNICMQTRVSGSFCGNTHEAILIANLDFIHNESLMIVPN